MRRKKMIRIGLAAVLALIFLQPLFSGPAVGAAGVCRSVECGPPSQKDGPSQECDTAKLEQAKKEFERELQAYLDAEKKATGEWTEASEIYKKADELFRETFDLPENNTRFTELGLHWVMDKAVHSSGGKALAEEFASFASATTVALMLYKFGEADWKMVKYAKASNAHGEAALKLMDDAYAHLQLARKAHERMEKLAANCKSKESGGGKSAKDKESQDEWKSSGQKEADAARQILSSWKKVSGGYEDANQNFYDADSAFEQALAIVQSRDESAVTGSFIRVANSENNKNSAGQTNRQTLPDKKRAKAVEKIVRGFTKVAMAGKAFMRVGAELRKIGDAHAKTKMARKKTLSELFRDRPLSQASLSACDWRVALYPRCSP